MSQEAVVYDRVNYCINVCFYSWFMAVFEFGVWESSIKTGELKTL